MTAPRCVASSASSAAANKSGVRLTSLHERSVCDVKEWCSLCENSDWVCESEKTGAAAAAEGTAVPAAGGRSAVEPGAAMPPRLQCS